MKVIKKVFDASRTGQKISVNIYKPSNIVRETNKKPLILFFTHANGFHKEIWEPTISRLLSHESQAWQITQAISMDGYNHGDSAILNRTSIFEEEFSPWFMNARDILVVIRQLQTQGISPLGAQSIVGIGHSWGAASLLLAELESPLTFSSLIITDPVLFSEIPRDNHLTKITLKRRWQWSDINNAREYFEPHPFFKIWDKRILDLHLQYGLESLDGSLALKCRPNNEAAVFSGAKYASVHAKNNLWRVQCPVAFLTGELSGPSPPEYIKEITKDMVDCRHKVLQGLGHLLVHENPDLAADHYIQFLDEFAPKINVAQEPKL